MGRPPHADSLTTAVVDFIADLPYDTTLEYADIALHTGHNPEIPEELSNLRSTVYNARKRLLRDHKRALESIRGTGWRIVPPFQQTTLAQQQRTRSQRALGRAENLLEHLDTSNLTTHERGIVEAMARVVSYQSEFNNNVEQKIKEFDQRQKQHEKELAEKEQRHTNDIAELRRQIGRIEHRLPPETPQDPQG